MSLVHKLCYHCNADTRLFQGNKINIMAADALAPCVTRPSAAIILSTINLDIIVFVSSAFQQPASFGSWRMLWHANIFFMFSLKISGWQRFQNVLNHTRTCLPFQHQMRHLCVRPDAGDRIFRFWGSIPCLLMPWLLKSPVHQQTWY